MNHDTNRSVLLGLGSDGSIFVVVECDWSENPLLSHPLTSTATAMVDQYDDKRRWV